MWQDVLCKHQQPGKALHQSTDQFIIHHAVMACPTCLHKVPHVCCADSPRTISTHRSRRTQQEVPLQVRLQALPSGPKT